MKILKPDQDRHIFPSHAYRRTTEWDIAANELFWHDDLCE